MLLAGCSQQKVVICKYVDFRSCRRAFPVSVYMTRKHWGRRLVLLSGFVLVWAWVNV